MTNEAGVSPVQKMTQAVHDMVAQMESISKRMDAIGEALGIDTDEVDNE